MLQVSQVVLADLTVLGQNLVSQEYLLPLETLEDREARVAQEVPPCLDKLPLVDQKGLGDRVAQCLPFLHSGQGILGPLEDL